MSVVRNRRFKLKVWRESPGVWTWRIYDPLNRYIITLAGRPQFGRWQYALENGLLNMQVIHHRTRSR